MSTYRQAGTVLTDHLFAVPLDHGRPDGEQVEVFVFPERSAHHAPLSPVDQKPMRRAGRGAVLALLDP